MRKKRPWYRRLWLALWANMRVVSGEDKDFKENVKIGVKTGVKF